MKRAATTLLASLCCLTLAWEAPIAFAGSKGKKKGASEEKYEQVENKHKSKSGRKWVKIQYRKNGGPPLWAPAHGYRSKRDDDGDEHRSRTTVVVKPQETVYVAPYGINVGRCNREAVGSVVGGALGGIAGSTIGKGQGRTAAIIGGTVVGVLVGGAIGRTMDGIDQACVGQTLEHAPNQSPVEWQDPDKKQSYHVTPTETYQAPDGRYCREYVTTATIGGKRQEIYGTACRQPDGAWQIVK
jgi:surface antigen